MRHMSKGPFEQEGHAKIILSGKMRIRSSNRVVNLRDLVRRWEIHLFKYIYKCVCVGIIFARNPTIANRNARIKLEDRRTRSIASPM